VTTPVRRVGRVRCTHPELLKWSGCVSNGTCKRACRRSWIWRSLPPHHPLRKVKRFADRPLASLSPSFDVMYRAGGRPSIPPERLLKASLLTSLYSVRSEQVFCEELDYQVLRR
jgi:hypothetical protein